MLEAMVAVGQTALQTLRAPSSLSLLLAVRYEAATTLAQCHHIRFLHSAKPRASITAHSSPHHMTVPFSGEPFRHSERFAQHPLTQLVRLPFSAIKQRTADQIGVPATTGE
jgi:hypothetical protein